MSHATDRARKRRQFIQAAREKCKGNPEALAKIDAFVRMEGPRSSKGQQRIPLSSGNIKCLERRLAILALMADADLPVEMEIEALAELASETGIAVQWEEATGTAFPQTRTDWAAIVCQPDLRPLFNVFSGRVRLREVLAAIEGSNSSGPIPTDRPTHSPDFTSVNWYGTSFSFSRGNQAESIRVLWKAFEEGGHSLSQETIRKQIESAADHFELAKVFRARKKGHYVMHPAWGTMIRSSGKGTYRLHPPR